MAKIMKLSFLMAQRLAVEADDERQEWPEDQRSMPVLGHIDEASTNCR